MSNKEKTNWYICPRCFGTGKLSKQNMDNIQIACLPCRCTGAITSNIREDIVTSTPMKRRNKIGFLLQLFRYNQHKPIAKAWISVETAMYEYKLNRVKAYLKYKAINYKGK